MEPTGVDGQPSTTAGGHPWEVTTSFGVPTTLAPPDAQDLYQPVGQLKSVAVELPLGFIGNPLAIPRCTEAQLRRFECPSASRVGSFAALAGGNSAGSFYLTNQNGLTPRQGGCCSAIYNIAPSAGYPAEFGLTFQSIPVIFYASVIHGPSGYRLRLSTSGLPTLLETSYAALTFFGDPATLNGEAPDKAFLTNPASCPSGALSASIEAEPWEAPGHPFNRESVVYPELTGCNLLQFGPSLEFAPAPAAQGGTTQADEPSAYDVDVNVPQHEALSESSTPNLKDAVVALPPGVAISPPAAYGLAGCDAEGPSGINLGSDEVGTGGEDLGNPAATELGAGHRGGNGSPYDDGLYHAAPGHCPDASIVGEVEVTTPLLATPLHGDIYLSQPKCGQAGQPACTEASSTNGELFGLYLEAEGSGVRIKIPGSIAADPATGQLTGTFTQNPQFPFSDLKLHFRGGSTAPVANPQTCGTFTTNATLTSWASPQLAGVSLSSSPFAISWDGGGGACPASLPFAPGFSAGVTVPVARASSPLVLDFSRQDREQNLSGLTETLPRGLLGNLASVPLCGDAQASAGTCDSTSQIGTTSVTAGSGSNPLPVGGGRVYLTTGYKGAPFGLSIVVPAIAGPFNLGDVVVRAAIHIDPSTAQVTVVADPLPQIKDGVPFRLRSVHVSVDRADFILNPTSCAQQQVTATLTGAEGAQAAVQSPFAVAGCTSLPFAPALSASTQAKTTKASGASLVVKVSQRPGEANIGKVLLQLPKVLPARLTTLQKACTDTQFNTNPAGCPEASNIGTARAITPILHSPLAGPAYLVSHGGAAFPDVVFLLQGEGVRIVLDGKTDIKKGITYSRFETVPDAPISSFETVLPQGPHSVLAANGDLCAANLAMPTTITGQNGSQTTHITQIVPIGCAKPSIKHLRLRATRRGLRAAFSLTRAGKVRLSATGLRTVNRTFSAGAHQVVLRLTKRGLASAKRHGKTKLRIRLTLASSVTSVSRSVRL